MATPTVTNTTTSNLISNVDSGYLTNLIVSGTSSTSYEFIGGTDVTTTLGDTNSYITTGYNFINYNTNTPFGGFGKDGEIRIDPDTGECKFYIASKYKWVDCEILETKNSTDKDGKKITIFSISFDISVSDIKQMRENRKVFVEKYKPVIIGGISSSINLTYTYAPNSILTTTPSTYINLGGTNNLTVGTNGSVNLGTNGRIVYDSNTNNIKMHYNTI